MYTRFTTVLLAMGCVVSIGIPVEVAASSQVHLQQHVSVSATSENMTASQSSVHVDGHHANVFLETRVNGEVIEHIEEVVPFSSPDLSLEQQFMATPDMSRMQDQQRRSTFSSNTDDPDVLREIRLLLRSVANLLTPNNPHL